MAKIKNLFYKAFGLSEIVTTNRSVSWDDLTIQVSNISNVTEVYSDWAWLLGDEEIRPIMITKFGDMFYRRLDGQVYFLDTMEGKISCICGSNEDFNAFINKTENIEHYLMSNLIYVLINQGKVTSLYQCYSYKILPVLGGESRAENVEIMDAVVNISITGQIHRQVKDLPEDTVINKFSITD
jgi:hypothetical protein